MRSKVVAFVVGLAVLILTSCGHDNEDQARYLLEDKYEEHFQVLDILERKPLDQTYTVLAEAQDHPDVLFEATVTEDGSCISDEYVASRVCRKIEDQFIEDMGLDHESVQVKVQSIGKTINSTNGDMDPREFAEKKQGNRFVIYLVCYKGQEKDIYDAIDNGLKNLDYISGSIQLCMADKETLQEVQEYLHRQAKIYYEYDRIIEPYFKTVIRFSEGKMEE